MNKKIKEQVLEKMKPIWKEHYNDEDIIGRDIHGFVNFFVEKAIDLAIELTRKEYEKDIPKFIRKSIAKEIFDEIEKETKSLGIEKLAKEHPDFVHYITFNYNDWQNLKKKWNL